MWPEHAENMTYSSTVNTFYDFLPTPSPVDNVHPPVRSNPGAATTGYPKYTFYFLGRVIYLLSKQTINLFSSTSIHWQISTLADQTRICTWQWFPRGGFNHLFPNTISVVFVYLKTFSPIERSHNVCACTLTIMHARSLAFVCEDVIEWLSN